mgnify:CR=1 FL=1|tara:strand:- start:27969 stop:29993 length:2025 start_codon:yes stop_codon:yes gene_type:complete
MDQKIKSELEQKNPSVFHVALLEHCKSLVLMSMTAMSQFYDEWDSAQDAYAGVSRQKKADKTAEERGEPTHLVVPLTYAQVQTFIAFAMNLLQQREHFFELEGTGEEDHRSAKLGEALLNHNLEKNNFSQLLYQFLLDIGRFSIGVIKHCWVRETHMVWTKELVPQASNPFMLLGKMFGAQTKEEWQDVKKEMTSYVGNRLTAISPYRFYPDTRLPLTRFQEGEFCASEDEVTRSSLVNKEFDGVYAGVAHVQDMKKEVWDKRRGDRFNTFKPATTEGRGKATVSSTVILTEVQVVLIPSEFMLGDGTPMGDSKRPEKWIVTYANDNRIIRAEPLGYEHNHFTYCVGQFSSDQHSLISESISSLIGHLQSVIDWFINSHITNVRKHISNRLVVDTSAIYFEDLRDHKAVIRLKPGFANTGVDKYIKQLNVSDVTRSHITDVQSLVQFMSITTAISDNLMGQYHTGRRSAREASNTSNASSARLKNIIKIIYDTALMSLGQDMLSNSRDGLDEDTFVTVLGDEFPDWSAYEHFTNKNGGTKVAVNRTHLAGRSDFKLFDGTLPTEKIQQAETIEKTLLALMSNPQGLPVLTQLLGYDPKKLFEEVLILRGVKHPKRFQIDAFRQQEIQQQAIQQQQIENQNEQQPELGGLPTGGTNTAQPVPAGQPTFESLLTGS